MRFKEFYVHKHIYSKSLTKPSEILCHRQSGHTLWISDNDEWQKLLVQEYTFKVGSILWYYSRYISELFMSELRSIMLFWYQPVWAGGWVIVCGIVGTCAGAIECCGVWVVGGGRFEGGGEGQCWVVVAIAGEDLTASGWVKLLSNCMICMRSSNCLSDRTCRICGAILRWNDMTSSSFSSDSMCFNSCCSNGSTVIAVFSSGLARFRAHGREPSKNSIIFIANLSQYGMMYCFRIVLNLKCVYTSYWKNLSS